MLTEWQQIVFEKFLSAWSNVANLTTLWQALKNFEKVEKNILLPLWQHFSQRLKMLEKIWVGGRLLRAFFCFQEVCLGRGVSRGGVLLEVVGRC